MAKRPKRRKKTETGETTKVAQRSLWRSIRRRLEIVASLTTALVECKAQEDEDKNKLLLVAPKEIRTFLVDKEVLHYLFLQGVYRATLFRGNAGYSHKLALAEELKAAWKESVQVTTKNSRGHMEFTFKMV